MSKHFGSTPKSYQTSTKAVFLSQNKQTTVFCGLCQMFNQQQTVVSHHKQIKLSNNLKPKLFIKNDKNLQKLIKKSLKETHKFKDSFIKVQSMQPVHEIMQSKKIQKSTNMNSEIILKSNDFKKTQSSEKCIYFSQSPVYFQQQQKRKKQIPYSSSCINLKNSFNQSIKVADQNYKNKVLPNIPMVRSVSSQLISVNKSLNLSNIESNRKINHDNQKLEQLWFKSPMTQNFTSLQISPVRHHPILEQSERSGNNTGSGNDRDQTTINKLLDLQSRQNLSKNSEQQLISTRTFKVNEKINNLQENMSDNFSQIKVLPIVPQISKDFSQKSVSNRDYLQISFDQTQKQDNKKLEKQNISKSQKKLINENIVENLSNSNEIQIKVSGEKVLSVDIKSDQNEPQHTENSQSRNIQNQKTIKNPSSNTFGRYSVQIPKSKNFKNLKVRRTISMKDQQDSSQEETSQVIYGFRNINNLVVMQDIAEDMQQSYMTKRQINFQRTSLKLV